MRRAGLVFGLVMVAFFAVAQSALGFGQVPGSPFQAGTEPSSVAFSPAGRLLAVANSRRYRGLAYSLSVFSVDQRTGALTQVPGSPFPAGSGPYSVVFSPGGRLLAAANAYSNSVSIFAVNRGTGALTPVPGSPFATAGGPVAFSPGGGLLATANLLSNSVSVFSVSQETGALTQVPGSPFSTGIGSVPRLVAFSPVGDLLAVGNQGEAAVGAGLSAQVLPSVSVFSVNQATGALTPVPGSPFAAGDGPSSLAFSPAGTLLAVASFYDQTVLVFSVNQATGALTPVPGSPFSTGIGSLSQSLAFGAGGRLLAVAGDSRPPRGLAYTLGVFSVSQTTGALTQLPGSPFRAGLGVVSVAFSPVGGLLAAPVSAGHSVAVFSTAAVSPSNHFTVSRVHNYADGKITLAVRVPGPGRVDVLETAWDDNLARLATLLQPAAQRFVFARAHTSATAAATILMSVRPNARGQLLVHHPTYLVTLRMWVTYTPVGGRSRSLGLYGLHLRSPR